MNENSFIDSACQQGQRNEMAGMFVILYKEGCPETSNIHSLGIYQPEYPRSSTALPNQFHISQTDFLSIFFMERENYWSFFL